MALSEVLPGAAAVPPHRDSIHERIDDAVKLATRALNTLTTAKSEKASIRRRQRCSTHTCC